MFYFQLEFRLDDTSDKATLIEHSLVSDIVEYCSDDIKIINTAGDLQRTDELRHALPSHARERARTLGGATKSTDLNIRIDATEPEEIAAAHAALAAICAQYESTFDSSSSSPPYERVTYGHAHPGMQVRGEGYRDGGGFDPHIRVTIRLNDEEVRLSAPEDDARMKKTSVDFYRALLALDGKHGIQICSPEKSRFINTTYINWLRLFHPEKLAEYEQTILKLGFDASGRPISAFRMPYDHPDAPRQTGGVIASLSKSLLPDSLNSDLPPEAFLNQFSKATWELSQLSHRDTDVRRLLREVCLTVQEKLGLSKSDQFPFFIESPEEGQRIVERNFGSDHTFRIETVTGLSLDDLNSASSKFPDTQNTFYSVDLTSLGLPGGLSLLITPRNAVKEAYARTVSGKNKTAFRNLHGMWEKYPDQTDETPNIPAIAALGLLLQRNELNPEHASTRPAVVTVNPGPAQVRDEIWNQPLVATTAPKEQLEAIRRIRKYFGISEEFAVAFQTSATQAMQVLAESLARVQDTVHVIQVTNDAFGNRLNDILSAELGKEQVHTISTPWTTTEQSKLDAVAARIGSEIGEGRGSDKKPVLFITPHKTSTTANVDPYLLIQALEKIGCVQGRDYELVCDVTSGVGGIEYRDIPDEEKRAAELSDETRTKIFDEYRIRFSMFGSVQKMGCPPGLSMLTLSPGLQSLLLHDDEDTQTFGLARSMHQAETGDVVNPVGLALLDSVVRHELEQNRSPLDVSLETREKMNMLLAFVASHPGLDHLVPDPRDRSPLLAGVRSQELNLPLARGLLADLFGKLVGAGYGVYGGESLRFHLTTVTREALSTLLEELRLVLELPEVTQTRNPHAPLFALPDKDTPWM